MLYYRNKRRKDTIMATTFKIFTERVIAELQSRLDDYEINEQTVIKQNDLSLHGFSIRRKDSDIAPTMYLDAPYKDYCNGHSLDSIVDSMVEMVTNSEPIAPKEAAEFDMCFDNIKDRLTARMIDSELNQAYLQEHPHKDIGAGLALIAEININSDYRCVISNSLAEQYDMDEVFSIALRNMQNSHPAILMNMETAMFGEIENILNGNGHLDTMGVLMIEGAEGFGATALAYDGTADKIRAIIGDYYILPSSLHELIILRDNGDFGTADLKNMVVSANQTVVDDIDILSNSVFHFGEDGLSRVA